MPENARPPRSLRRATVDEPVLQGEWAEAPPNYTEQAARADPLGALLSLVGPYRGILGEEIAALEDLRAGYLNANLNAVVGGLAKTLDSGEWGTATLILRASEAASDRDEADDEHDTNAPETVIDFSNLHEYVNPAEVNSGDAGLRAIFARMASGIGKVATEQAFQRWYNSPVLTRDAFARLFDGESSEPMQQARVAGALSYQAGYTGSSGKQYTSVTYKLGNRGSIDFQAPKSSKKWSDPVDTKTLVNLQKGSAKKGEGITKNGTAVNIKNASRSQHFSIANRIRNIEGSGSPTGWTWHHIETPYLMVLVDRMVHSKHGHNGGFFLW
jgi:hypothetical protein